MSGTRAISTTSRLELSSGFFFLQGKAPKEIHVILTETLGSFLPGRAKDLSAPLCTTLYYTILYYTALYYPVLLTFWRRNYFFNFSTLCV